MNRPLNSTLTHLYLQQQPQLRPDSACVSGSLPASLLKSQKQLSLAERENRHASPSAVARSPPPKAAEKTDLPENGDGLGDEERSSSRRLRRQRRLAAFAAAAVSAVQKTEEIRGSQGETEEGRVLSADQSRTGGGVSVAPCKLPSHSLSDVPALEDAVLEQIRSCALAPFLMGAALDEAPTRTPTPAESVSQKAPCRLRWFSALLIGGPSGVGKSFLAEAIVGSLEEALRKHSAASRPESAASTQAEEIGFVEKDDSAQEKEGGNGALRFFRVTLSSFSGISAGGEEALDAVFAAVVAAAPSALLLERLDVFATKTLGTESGLDSSTAERQSALLFSLCRHLDALADCQVLVLGECESPAALPGALRRSGRFDRELLLKPPEAKARREILQALLRSLPCDVSNVDAECLAAKSGGFVAADFHALTQRALVAARLRASEPAEDAGDASLSPTALQDGAAMRSVSLRQADFEEALSDFKPSAEKSDGGVSTRGRGGASWVHVGGLGKTKRILEERILFPVLHPQLYKRIGLRRASGVLLFGPPGCGKTLLARALANECRATFLSVKGPELLSKFVGESEARLRALFCKAAVFQPCLIFFDEIDALCGSRGGALNQTVSSLDAADGDEEDGGSGEAGKGEVKGNPRKRRAAAAVALARRAALRSARSSPSETGGSARVEERLIAQMLTELDGIGDRGQVFVVGATNRPDALDAALLRPGRFEVRVYVQLPTEQERALIFRRGLERIIQESLESSARGGFANEQEVVRRRLDEFDVEELARLSKRFSGADIDAVLRCASLALLRERRDFAFQSLREALREELRQCEERGEQRSFSSGVLWRSDDVQGMTPLELLSACRDCRGGKAEALAERFHAEARSGGSEDSLSQGGSSQVLNQKHLLEALKEVRPSVSEAQVAFFDEYAATLAANSADV